MFPLDHVPFATGDIEAAAARLKSLGFTSVRGTCRWPMPAARHEAPSLSVMFEQHYLDVIGYEGAPEGLSPTGVVLGTDDFAAALAKLRGFHVAPYEIERTLEDGRRIRYQIAAVRGPGRLPVSILRDHDPLAMRTADSLRHANGALRLSRVVLGASNEPAARRELRRLTSQVEVSARTELEFGPTGPRFPWG